MPSSPRSDGPPYASPPPSQPQPESPPPLDSQPPPQLPSPEPASPEPTPTPMPSSPAPLPPPASLEPPQPSPPGPDATGPSQFPSQPSSPGPDAPASPQPPPVPVPSSPTREATQPPMQPGSPSLVPPPESQQPPSPSSPGSPVLLPVPPESPTTQVPETPPQPSSPRPITPSSQAPPPPQPSPSPPPPTLTPGSQPPPSPQPPPPDASTPPPEPSPSTAPPPPRPPVSLDSSSSPPPPSPAPADATPVEGLGTTTSSTEPVIVTALTAESSEPTLTAFVMTPDTEPPQIILAASALMTMEVYDPYVEYGATAVDSRDGALPVTVSADAVITTRTTSPDKPYAVVYTAVDAAGNRATARRLVRVQDSCEAVGEFRCGATLRCSRLRTCLAGDTEVAPAAPDAGQPFVRRPLDSLAPTITLLGDAQPYVTDKGISGHIHFLTVGETFTDPGATGTDLIPISGTSDETLEVDLSAAIFRRIRAPSGEEASAVSTRLPTSLGAPYLVSYDLMDTAGNRAKTVFRRVYVTCTEPEYLCPQDDPSDEPSCSVSFICGVPGLAASAAATSGFSTGGDGGSSSSSGLDSGSEADAALVPQFKLSAIAGSADRVHVDAGDAFAPCRGGLTAACDPGFSASLKARGDLNAKVYACADGVKNPLPYELVGLSYCGINTKYPGAFPLKYSLKWPSVGELVLTRTLVVRDSCAGERNCPAGLCSVDGYCADDPSGASAAAVEAAPNTPPVLTLTVTDDLGLDVVVKRGHAYELCRGNQRPTPGRPCEPLGTASDAEDGDLTSLITLCPDPEIDCAATQCAGDSPATKQPLDCGVDTANAPIGTSFRLRFVVYDTYGASATAERSITVLAPCAANQHYCEDATTASNSSASKSVSYVCSAVRCEQRAALAAMQAAAAQQAAAITSVSRLFLLPGSHLEDLAAAEADASLFLVYRQPAPVALTPCASFAVGSLANGSCAAIANDTVDGDLSPAITAAAAPVCPAGMACGGCSLAALTAGACLPGRYTLTYAVRSSTGNALSRKLDVYVEQLVSSTVALTLLPGGSAKDSTSRAAAVGLAASLASNATLRTQLLGPMITAMGFTAASVRGVALIGSPSVANASAGNGRAAYTYYTVKVSLNVTTGRTDSVPLSPNDEPPANTINTTATSANGSSAQSRKRSLLTELAESLGLGLGLEAPDGASDQAQEPKGPLAPALLASDDYETADYGTPHPAAAALEAQLQPLTTAASRPSSSGAGAATGRHPAAASQQGPRQSRRSSVRELLLEEVLGSDAASPLSSSAPSSTEPTTAASQAPVPALGLRSLLPRLSAVQAALDEAGGLLLSGGLDTTTTSTPDNDPHHTPSAFSHHRLPRRQRRRRLSAHSRALLADSGCGDLAPPSGNATLMAALGLAAAPVVASSCLSAPLDPMGLALGALDSAVWQVETLGQAMTDQQTYRSSLLELSATANGSFASMAASIASLYDMIDGASQAADQMRSAALAGALSLVQSALNEAEAATHYAIATASLVLDGLGAALQQADLEQQAVYASCVYSRSLAATFALPIARYADATTGAPGSGSGSGRRRSQLSRRGRSLSAGWTGQAESARTATAAADEAPSHQPAAPAGRLHAGYELGEVPPPSAFPPAEQALEYPRSRAVGSGRNTVLGGLLLHQTRRPPPGREPGGCIGSDPAFNPRSRLFDADVAAADYYNTTKGSPELNAGGLPCAFVAEGLPSFGSEGLGAAGYPVVLGAQLSAERALRAMAYVRDGGFLSAALTRSLVAQLLTYNADTRVLGAWRLTVSWTDDGAIAGAAEARAFPALNYQDSLQAGQARRFLPDLFLLLLTCGYGLLVAYDVSIALLARRERRLAAARLLAASGGLGPHHPAGNQIVPLGALPPPHGEGMVGLTPSAEGGSKAAKQGGSASPEGEASSASPVAEGVEEISAEEATTAHVKGHLRHPPRLAWEAAPQGMLTFRPRLGAGWVAVEAVVLGLMVAALVVLGVFSGRSAKASFSQPLGTVYDGDQTAAARMFLLRRQPGFMAVSAADATVNDTLANDASSNDTVLVGTPQQGTSSGASTAGGGRTANGMVLGAQPGGPGRWRLPANAAPLGTLVGLYDEAQDLHLLYSWYGLLQSLALFLLVLHWLAYLAHRRIGLLVRTLARAVPDLAHLVLVFAATSLAFGVALFLADSPTGPHSLGTFAQVAAYTLQFAAVRADGGGLAKGVSDSQEERSAGERVLAGVLYVAAAVLFIVFLVNLVVAVLLHTFRRVRRMRPLVKANIFQAATGAPSITHPHHARTVVPRAHGPGLGFIRVGARTVPLRTDSVRRALSAAAGAQAGMGSSACRGAASGSPPHSSGGSQSDPKLRAQHEAAQRAQHETASRVRAMLRLLRRRQAAVAADGDAARRAAAAQEDVEVVRMPGGAADGYSYGDGLDELDHAELMEKVFANLLTRYGTSHGPRHHQHHHHHHEGGPLSSSDCVEESASSTSSGAVSDVYPRHTDDGDADANAARAPVSTGRRSAPASSGRHSAGVDGSHAPSVRTASRRASAATWAELTPTGSRLHSLAPSRVASRAASRGPSRAPSQGRLDPTPGTSSSLGPHAAGFASDGTGTGGGGTGGGVSTDGEGGDTSLRLPMAPLHGAASARRPASTEPGMAQASGGSSRALYAQSPTARRALAEAESLPTEAPAGAAAGIDHHTHEPLGAAGRPPSAGGSHLRPIALPPATSAAMGLSGPRSDLSGARSARRVEFSGPSASAVTSPLGGSPLAPGHGPSTLRVHSQSSLPALSASMRRPPPVLVALGLVGAAPEGEGPGEGAASPSPLELPRMSITAQGRRSMRFTSSTGGAQPAPPSPNGPRAASWNAPASASAGGALPANYQPPPLPPVMGAEGEPAQWPALAPHSPSLGQVLLGKHSNTAPGQHPAVDNRRPDQQRRRPARASVDSSLPAYLAEEGGSAAARPAVAANPAQLSHLRPSPFAAAAAVPVPASEAGRGRSQAPGGDLKGEDSPARRPSARQPSVGWSTDTPRSDPAAAAAGRPDGAGALLPERSGGLSAAGRRSRRRFASFMPDEIVMDMDPAQAHAQAQAQTEAQALASPRAGASLGPADAPKPRRPARAGPRAVAEATERPLRRGPSPDSDCELKSRPEPELEITAGTPTAEAAQASGLAGAGAGELQKERPRKPGRRRSREPPSYAQLAALVQTMIEQTYNLVEQTLEQISAIGSMSALMGELLAAVEATVGFNDRRALRRAVRMVLAMHQQAHPPQQPVSRSASRTRGAHLPGAAPEPAPAPSRLRSAASASEPLPHPPAPSPAAGSSSGGAGLAVALQRRLGAESAASLQRLGSGEMLMREIELEADSGALEAAPEPSGPSRSAPSHPRLAAIGQRSRVRSRLAALSAIQAEGARRHQLEEDVLSSSAAGAAAAPASQAQAIARPRRGTNAAAPPLPPKAPPANPAAQPPAPAAPPSAAQAGLRTRASVEDEDEEAMRMIEDALRAD
ncbi:hypothetical protein HYH03_017242 [Edaphochlamys debaryana]|uniref:Polycystin cation channel PKD1/PKD2 domain-containing protein n=1 Tax=Edaphochlamys debaryana TaxID=47281 RepID=A0A835XKH4_9CHLO|nr:hypothetical protein HYH03_017242 [Edaphochlamys debaryana]|eukprot:KAG2483921.1 hypothetical protein HYH03_017242 [Edaphochlamys debaryana]